MSDTSAEAGLGFVLAVTAKTINPLRSATIRFAGDSGDGMQLAGTQFTDTSAAAGQRHQHVAGLSRRRSVLRPGTLAGVSGYQIHFSSTEIYTPGDEVDALVAMNPAALRPTSNSVRARRNRDRGFGFFGAGDLQQGRVTTTNPMEDGSVGGLSSGSGSDRQADSLPRTKPDGAAREGFQPLQEHVRAGAGLLALRPSAGFDAAAHPAEVREKAGGGARPMCWR